MKVWCQCTGGGSKHSAPSLFSALCTAAGSKNPAPSLFPAPFFRSIRCGFANCALYSVAGCVLAGRIKCTAVRDSRERSDGVGGNPGNPVPQVMLGKRALIASVRRLASRFCFVFVLLRFFAPFFCFVFLLRFFAPFFLLRFFASFFLCFQISYGNEIRCPPGYPRQNKVHTSTVPMPRIFGKKLSVESDLYRYDVDFRRFFRVSCFLRGNTHAEGGAFRKFPGTARASLYFWDPAL